MKQKIAILGALIGWFAVIGQYWIMIENPVARDGTTLSYFEITIRFFSYFTMLTNTLVALVLTAHAVTSSKLSFFRMQGMATAVSVYILIVALVYQLVLRQTWSPTGLQRVVDELLHSVMPVFFLVFWFKYAAKPALRWSQIPKWLIFPFVYMICVLVRGLLSGFYPYFFIDATKLPVVSLVINIAVLISLFAVFGLLFVFISKQIGDRLKN
ncbi:Pr6Pr family membrane protein [Pseudobdellovibrio exovorus]|uniref:Integral membrane protein n=1 Tax=Pseudobdellovibrio exovorus JSS TaxID=1184267 RepID=M4V8W8_9BACT|nr:Pr6Pr family membrane protein [Pseudobdellovibrio exovorus]AGH94461.1 hypothetical protein A11Q_241 [Pseudobdellovibrio exovorus JSS]